MRVIDVAQVFHYSYIVVHWSKVDYSFSVVMHYEYSML